MGVPDVRRQRLRAAGPWALDGLLAVATAAAGVTLLATVLPFDPGSPRSLVAYLLVLAHTLPIAVRRRWPLPVLAAGLATGAAFARLPKSRPACDRPAETTTRCGAGCCSASTAWAPTPV